MLKATSVNRYGAESCPVSVEVNEHGYIPLPEDPDAVSYNVYAPLKGFESVGPWYFKKAYRRGEARRARFTVVGLYDQIDLIPQLCPPTVRGFKLPNPAPGQDFWMIGGTDFAGTRYTPYAIVKCP